MSQATEVVLQSASLDVAILPGTGARLHRLRAFGHDLLRTPDDPAAHRGDPFFWGAYPMAPWCSRAPAGPGTTAGRPVELAANFPDGSAIHGLVATRAWADRGGGTFEIRWQAGAGGWPWSFGIRLSAAVRGATLTLDYRLTNLDDGPMPAGLGLHPWFRTPLELAIPAAAAYASNVASDAEPISVGGTHDLRSLAPPATGLDGTWTALREPVVRVRWPALGVSAELEQSSGAAALVAVASPATLPAVAIEPQTHGPDPFRRLARGEPDAPVLLAPGASLELGLRWTFTLARNVLASDRYG